MKNNIEQEKKKMVKHVILWQLKDELTAEEKLEVKKGIKEGLDHACHLRAWA